MANAKTFFPQVVASLLFASALTGFFSGHISDRISRKYTVSIGAAIFATGSAICCAAPNLAALISGRVIAGLGEGLFLSPANTYVVEIAPKDLRGRLAAIPSVYTALGESHLTIYARCPTNLIQKSQESHWASSSATAPCRFLVKRRSAFPSLFRSSSLSSWRLERLLCRTALVGSSCRAGSQRLDRFLTS